MGLPDIQKATPKITVVDVNDSETSHTFGKFCRGFQLIGHEYYDIRYAWAEEETANGESFALLKPNQIK